MKNNIAAISPLLFVYYITKFGTEQHSLPYCGIFYKPYNGSKL